MRNIITIGVRYHCVQDKLLGKREDTVETSDDNDVGDPLWDSGFLFLSFFEVFLSGE